MICNYLNTCLIVIFSTLIIEAHANNDCPWLNGTSGKLNVLICMDGTQCSTTEKGWGCCSTRGGRAKCPMSHPIMCRRPNQCHRDHCCSDNEDNYCQNIVSKGPRPCHQDNTPDVGDLVVSLCQAIAAISSIASIVMIIPLYKAIQKEHTRKKKMLLRNVFFMSIFDFGLSVAIQLSLITSTLHNVQAYHDTFIISELMIVLFAYGAQTSYVSIGIQIFMDIYRYRDTTYRRKAVLAIFLIYIIFFICFIGYSIYVLMSDRFPTPSWWRPLLDVKWWIPLVITIVFSILLLLFVFYHVFYVWVGQKLKGIMSKTSVFVGVFVVTWSFALIFGYEVKTDAHCPWWYDALVYLFISFSGIGNFITWMLYFKDIRSNLVYPNLQKPLLFKDTGIINNDSHFLNKKITPTGIDRFSNEWRIIAPDAKTECSEISTNSPKRGSIFPSLNLNSNFMDCRIST